MSLIAGLKNSPTTKQLEQCLDDMNAGRPQCPVGLHTLVMPSRKNTSKVDPEAQPVVYLNCGHVQGRHAWGATSENGKRTCPICLGETDTAQLKIGSESGKFSLRSTESVRPEKQTFVSINLKCGFLP